MSRWKRRFIRQLHVFTKEIGFCELFLYVCRLNPHHEALVGHGFTHAHIVALSQHPAALGTVAVKYQDMIAALPEATHEAIVGVGKQWSGARALEALLTVAGELRGPPLQLDTGFGEQWNREVS
ncbi:hypothetical protein Xvtf_19970 [Xanthomonas campestris pv. vitistrifoliae]|nr:hypothetical protein Xvtf_19970 [Xanthomonas campestris pv. vitistrifoliae]